MEQPQVVQLHTNHKEVGKLKDTKALYLVNNHVFMLAIKSKGLEVRKLERVL